MSVKNLDKQGRWRNKIVAFRMSEEENELLNKYVKLSGLTKQDYMIQKVLNNNVVINGNPRVFKALKGSLSDILDELKRVQNVSNIELDEWYYIFDVVEIVIQMIEKI